MSEEENLRFIIEAVPSGVLIVDYEGKIAFCNQQTEILFGYERSEMIGLGIEILVPERFRAQHPQYRRAFVQAPRARKMGTGRDLFGLCKNGREIPIEIGLNPLVIKERSLVLATIVDLSLRKELEGKLMESARRLEDKSREMEQFVYTVSHDLKSPLVTSSGFLGILKEDLALQRYDKLDDSLMRVERANRRMNQLIDDLLQISRIGRVKLDLENVDMVALIASVVDGLNPLINEKSAVVKIEKPLHKVLCDPRRVYQVFENLFVNALKYCNSSEPPEIVVGEVEQLDTIHFFVKDNGPGIPKEYHQKIFGLFQRLERDDRGTGVGLAVVSKVMGIHGGRAWVESEPGNGATFWLAFPKNFRLGEDDSILEVNNGGPNS